MLPNVGPFKELQGAQVDPKEMGRVEAIISSMTRTPERAVRREPAGVAVTQIDASRPGWLGLPREAELAPIQLGETTEDLLQR